MSQHKLYIHEEKTANWKAKKGKVLLNRNFLGESVQLDRPLSSGVMIGQKAWQSDEGIVFRSRAATFNGSPSSTCDLTSTATCYSCLFDEGNGREFCEIMGSRYCKHCIKTSRQKEIHDEVTSALGISNNGSRCSYRDAFFQIRQSPTLAFPSGRRLFTRLHNFSINSEYYINPIDGIETALASPREISCETGSSNDRNLQMVNQSIPTLQVPGKERVSRTQKKQKNGGTSTVKRKFVMFNGLPIEPPLITVDLSNQIMNQPSVKES